VNGDVQAVVSLLGAVERGGTPGAPVTAADVDALAEAADAALTALRARVVEPAPSAKAARPRRRSR